MMALEHIITLKSGLSFDFSNMFGKCRLDEDTVAKEAASITKAYNALENLRQTGEVQGHLSKDATLEHVYFTRLPYIKEGNPNTEDLLTELKTFGQKVRTECAAVIFCGIGGSYLGGKVLFDAFTGALWERTEALNLPEIYFSGNSLDVEEMEETWQKISSLQDKKIALVTISKSGTTLEPTAAFLYFYEKLQQSKSLQATVAVVTDKHNNAGPLNVLAKENEWPIFDVAEGIGGRFSVLSTPGLIVAAVLGMDLDALLLGAADMDGATRENSLTTNPALANAVYKYLAYTKCGCQMEVLMPYSRKLASLGNWYVQLLAESLGKKKEKAGATGHYGRTPLVAIGTTDMHSQTQLHQEGPRDKVVQFIQRGGLGTSIKLHNSFKHIPSFAKLEGLDVNEALCGALASNAEALSSDHRFNACYYLPKLNAYYLGQILYYFMLTVAYEGFLAEVDAFDQPGVEVYKRIMHKKFNF